MQEDGTFMTGGNYLPQEMLPREWGYNSGNYFVNLTFLPFMEVAYRCTLLKVKSTGKWNQDRSVSLRLRPLKEGKWWPSVVIGSNDLLTTGELNPFLDSGGNRYFSSVYAVGTKHFGFYGHDIGVTVGGHVPFRSRSENKGVFGGVSYRPAFLKPLEVMAEYDSKVVNVGVSARLFDHFSLYAYCYDFKTVAGGLRYELTPRPRAFRSDEVRMPWDGRVELVLYPQITLNNSWLDKIYGTVINIAPAVEARLWKGAAFTGQVILPVWNNMVGQMDYIRAGVLTLSQEFGLPGGAFGRVTVGNFTNSRMGADLKLRYATPDDRWLFGLEGGVTGSSTFYEGKWQVSNWKRVSGSVSAKGVSIWISTWVCTAMSMATTGCGWTASGISDGRRPVCMPCTREARRTAVSILPSRCRNGASRVRCGCACRNITRWNIRDRAVLNTSTAVSDRTTRPGRTRATAFLMIGEIRIDDLFGESVLKTDSQENIFQ